MNRILASVVLVASVASLALSTGCATVQPGAPTQAERIGNIAEVAAYTGTAVWLVDHPADAPKFAAAAAALGVLTAPSPEDLHRILYTLPIRQLKSEKGVIIIGAAILLYESELPRLTPIDQQSLAGTVARRIQSGITNALANTTAPTK